jgi:type II secretory pathway pseudopilin PulG
MAPVATPKQELKRPAAGPALGAWADTVPWAQTRVGSSLVRRLSRIAARPHVILLVFVVIAVALNFWETRGQTFYSDEWGRLFFPSSDNDSFASLLRWRSGHLVILHVLLYKGLLGVFGADSYTPFRIVEALLVGMCGLLFYALARTRAGAWPSLAATLVLLFLGSAWEVTATPYGSVILLPVAFGLAALVCLQRLPRRGDLLACLLLIAAVSSHSDGLAFVAGAAVLLALQSGRRFWTRLWVVGVPALLYVTWLAWYRLTASGPTPEPVQPHNLGEVPSTALSVFAAGLSSISGFFGASGPGIAGSFNLQAGYLLLGLLVIGVIWRVRSGSPPAREIWVPVVLALTFWILLGMVTSTQRAPTESRYIYPSAVFLLLILLEFTRSIRLTPLVVLIGVGALLVSLVPNMINLHEQARQIRAAAAVERVELGALELLRDEVPAASIPYLSRKGNVLAVGGAGFRILPVTYFPAFDRYGSPAASPAEIAATGEIRRQAADKVLLNAGDLALSSLSAGASGGGHGCRSTGQPIGVPAAGLEIRPHGSRANVTVAARRFASGYQGLDIPAGSGPMALKPGASQEGRPWSVQITGASVCEI